jgi:hypothetical protein
MADTKISALPASTTPLAGTEVLPIVQSGVTKQVSVANLTAGRAISATELTLTTGSVIVASGQGINFSAAGGDVLTTYDEGTFTPVWNGGTVTVSLSKFTRIGRQVTWIYDLTFGASASVSASTLTLPFACVDNWGAGSINFTDIGAALFVNLDGSIDALQFRAVANGASLACSTVATKRVVGIVTYNA